MKIESGNAYNQATDYLMTSVSLLVVGIMEDFMDSAYTYPQFIFLLLLSLLSVIFFGAMYYVDVYIKGWYLDSPDLFKTNKGLRGMHIYSA